jgi:energy-coupling factor transporter ATP-binding protein EcfA2
MSISCPACDAFALSGDGENLLCGACAVRVEANLLPLFLISGASGTGKSTLVQHLRPLLPECLVVGSDLMADRDRHAYLTRWLRVAYATAQCGRPLVLAGVIERSELEAFVDRALVGEIHMIALDCPSSTRSERLHGRPRWAKHSHEKRVARIEEHTGLIDRLRVDASLVIDTSMTSRLRAAEEASKWINERLVLAAPSMAPAG